MPSILDLEEYLKPYPRQNAWFQARQREWVFYMFLLGVPDAHLAQSLGVPVKAIKPMLQSILEGSDLEAYKTNKVKALELDQLKWNARQDFVLRKAREYGRTLTDTAMLLHRSPAEIKRRWIQLNEISQRR